MNEICCTARPVLEGSTGTEGITRRHLTGLKGAGQGRLPGGGENQEF